LDLEISEFLDLVVVDDQGLSVIYRVVEGLLGHGGVVWLLEADECEVSASFTLLELNVLNFSELREELEELNIGPVGWEVLDVEVASLLG